MAIQAVFDNLLVKPIRLPRQSAGGVAIPDTVKDFAYPEAEVISCGALPVSDGQLYKEISIKPGDIVIFSHKQHSIFLEGVEHFFIKYGAVIAVKTDNQSG